MPSLIDLRRRIRSVKNTQQVTKAMKMVSAAKLRRAQDRVIAARPYTAMFASLLRDVASAAAGDDRAGVHTLLVRRPENRVLLVMLTADRGLAGGFNSNLIRASLNFIAEHSEVMLSVLGRKGRDFWRKRSGRMVAEKTGISEKASYGDATELAKDIAGRFERDEIDAAYLLFNEFKSVLSQKVTLRRVLPLEIPESGPGPDFIYEQPPEQLLASLLPKYVEIAIYQAMLESAAAEQAARMTAMESATTNAGEVIDTLTLYMNRVRQASITREIIEVVSGAAATG